MLRISALLAIGAIECACSEINRPGHRIVLTCRNARGFAVRLVMSQGDFACRFAP